MGHAWTGLLKLTMGQRLLGVDRACPCLAKVVGAAGETHAAIEVLLLQQQYMVAFFLT